MSTTRRAVYQRLLPALGLLGIVVAWQLGIWISSQTLLPGPIGTARAIGRLVANGELLHHTVASLFRVTWGYLLGLAVAIPLGLALGWNKKIEHAIGPLIQILRPISPLAWIPLAILWLGVGDESAILVIFLAVVFPMTLSAMEAAGSIHIKYVRAGRNFGLSRRRLLFQVILPAALPQLLLGMRLALGIAWLVVVAAEMIAVSSGLGFLIVDASNAGNSYDLVLASVVTIGAVGYILDVMMRRLQSRRELAWSVNRLMQNAPMIKPIDRRRRGRG